MNILTAVPALTAPITAAALLLAACGSSGTTAATSAARAPTATIVDTGTRPVAGAAGTAGVHRALSVATGTHDHAGELCTGRDQAPYTAERLICVTGRLERTK